MHDCAAIIEPTATHGDRGKECYTRGVYFWLGGHGGAELRAGALGSAPSVPLQRRAAHAEHRGFRQRRTSWVYQAGGDMLWTPDCGIETVRRPGDLRKGRPMALRPDLTIGLPLSRWGQKRPTRVYEELSNTYVVEHAVSNASSHEGLTHSMEYRSSWGEPPLSLPSGEQLGGEATPRCGRAVRTLRTPQTGRLRQICLQSPPKTLESAKQSRVRDRWAVRAWA